MKKICDWHTPVDLPYNAWFDYADNQTNAGKKQKQCPQCKLWLFPDEYGKPPEIMFSPIGPTSYYLYDKYGRMIGTIGRVFETRDLVFVFTCSKEFFPLTYTQLQLIADKLMALENEVRDAIREHNRTT